MPACAAAAALAAMRDRLRQSHLTRRQAAGRLVSAFGCVGPPVAPRPRSAGSDLSARIEAHVKLRVMCYADIGPWL